MVSFVAYWLVFHIVGSMLCLVRNGTEFFFVIPRLRLVDDIILSCKSFPALFLQVFLAFLVQLGHVTSCLEACLAGGWYVIFILSHVQQCELLFTSSNRGRGTTFYFRSSGGGSDGWSVSSFLHALP